jgi:hypothetical protein
MKYRDVPQSGSQGNTVASSNRSGAYHRQRVSPDQPATPAQGATWDNITDVSSLRNLLGEECRMAWETFANGVHSRPNLGLSGPLGGCQLFRKLNRVLATCYRQPLLEPPSLPEFGSNPVEDFKIRKARGRISLILKVSPKLAWDARPPLEDLMVQSWAPYHAGTLKNGLYWPVTPARAWRNYHYGTVPGETQGLAEAQIQVLPHPPGVQYMRASKAIPYVQPSVFDMLAGASPASAMDGWAE